MESTASVLFLFLSLILMVSCNSGTKPIGIQDELPTVQEITKLQQDNIAGDPVPNPEIVFSEMAKYPIVAFGHNHTKDDHYLTFRKMIPKLRANGILLLAIEIPTSIQPMLDSIMSDETSAAETKSLLERLNADFKQTDFNKKYDPNPKVIYPLIDVILDWLNSGGIIAAIDVPYIYHEEKKENLYQTEIMYRAIKENSPSLFNNIKGIDINQLDDHKDLRIISEVRSAYMASVLNSYRLKGIKTVAFLGSMHTVIKVKSEKSVSESVVQITKNYFGQSAFALHPHKRNQNYLFYKAHPYLGNYAYGTID